MWWCDTQCDTQWPAGSLARAWGCSNRPAHGAGAPASQQPQPQRWSGAVHVPCPRSPSVAHAVPRVTVLCTGGIRGPRQSAPPRTAAAAWHWGCAVSRVPVCGGRGCDPGETPCPPQCTADVAGVCSCFPARDPHHIHCGVTRGTGRWTCQCCRHPSPARRHSQRHGLCSCHRPCSCPCWSSHHRVLLCQCRQWRRGPGGDPRRPEHATGHINQRRAAQRRAVPAFRYHCAVVSGRGVWRRRKSELGPPLLSVGSVP